jgi:magnesium transporter
MTLVDNAVYVSGHRSANPQSLDETYEVMRERAGMAWIDLYRPDLTEIRSVADEFGLPELAVEDALKGHQRAKLERYGPTLFVVLRPARFLDDVEKGEFGELHIFVGADFVVTIRHAESPDLNAVRQRLEANPELLAKGPQAVMYSILDQVVDDYQPIIADLEKDIDAIEDELFGGDPSVSRRIYELSREVIEFKRATFPLTSMVSALDKGSVKYQVDLELQQRLRNVGDHVMRIVEREESFNAILQNALTVNATVVGQRQNDEMQRLSENSLAQNEEIKRISSWAAILFAPTLVGTIYGMNFRHMPELAWFYGYPFSLALMVALGALLHAVFKRKKWL